ncbi:MULTISPECIES: M23 family metallopeptidase [unclassified Sedimentibacter]|uniref:M23 family metallopeptidase n=1 Tax=unclassified Sedimentibacter TaxID=2649220 RepID=UPI0027E07111|nr:M23 family metallopeptidase [Sedimentibacter sp. MB35-C1]WMJ77807.1 M23 family metallopeptidase [Sedimentibacter sp. MB35-C1]
MKKNRFKNAKMKMKNFFIRLKHKDTSFFIIALCIVLLATAIVWRYTSSPDPDGNNMAGNSSDSENIGANVDPYKDKVEEIIEDYENAQKDNDEEKDQPGNESIDLKMMKTPLAGEVYREFSMEDLVYYESIGEWRVHKGVDIKPKDTLLIESAFAGTVESVNTSDLTGTEIVIDHGNNIKTLYNNLVSASVKTGEQVQQGQTIGNVGKTASIEAADGAHLHFEIIVDGKNVNPMDYIN